MEAARLSHHRRLASRESGFYYLQSRYYDPSIGRFINADSYISTGNGLNGYNMFAYCGNNPVNNYDSEGSSFFSALAAVISHFVVRAISKRSAAKSKYNENTVNVYHEDTGTAVENKINAKFYNADTANGYVNISVDQSREITTRQEINAVLDVVISSPYYSKEQFGSKSFMRAQWVAHNACYSIASSGDMGYRAMQVFSGASNPIESASSLDIRSNGNMLRRQKIIYTVLSWVV